MVAKEPPLLIWMSPVEPAGDAAVVVPNTPAVEQTNPLPRLANSYCAVFAPVQHSINRAVFDEPIAAAFATLWQMLLPKADEQVLQAQLLNPKADE